MSYVTRDSCAGIDSLGSSAGVSPPLPSPVSHLPVITEEAAAGAPPPAPPPPRP